MPDCRMTLSANAGIALALGRYHIWIDALHQGKVPGFSTLDPQLLAQMQTHPDFQSPDVICVTHCHKDHYSPELTARAQRRWPGACVIHPDPSFPGGHLLGSTEETFVFDELQLRFFRLPHAGKQQDAVVHYGLMVSLEGWNVLFAGDCEVASPALADALKGQSVHLAVLDFPWFTLPRGRSFLRDILRPERVVLCHIPFARDDCWGYRKAVQRELEKLPQVQNLHILQEPFQRVDII